MDEGEINFLFDEFVGNEILQNISDAEALLTASQENALSTYEFTNSLQDLHTNGIVYSCSSATGTLPSFNKHLGEYNFEVFISTEANGPDCLYSKKLNKIFVNIDKPIPVLFRMTSHVPGLYARAVAVYVNSTDLHCPVSRCPTHKASDTEANKDLNLVEHVVRCLSPNAKYYEATDSGRFSVRVQLDAPQAGAEFTKICYKFTCLSSCQIRRKTGIIFTLENDKEEVLGREFMHIRVCSCPRRDKEKEETPKDDSQKLKKGLKRTLATLKENGNPDKVLKLESMEYPLISIPVKLCHLKELAKFASDLIYRDIGMEQRSLNDQEKNLLQEYKSTIETPNEALGQLLYYGTI